MADQKAKVELENAKAKVSEEVVEVIQKGRDLTQGILDEVFPNVREHFQKLGKRLKVIYRKPILKRIQKSLRLKFT